ncbi:cell separation during budding [Chytriomyces hyalinus]|nr:cell separation during budding [Chytriomyces hyalinus]
MFDYRDLVSYVLQVFHKSVDPEKTPSFDAEMEITDIIKRATLDGRTNVPIKLVSNLSAKNPLVAVYTTQPVLAALAHFVETPTLHRLVVLEKTDGVDKFVGVLSQSRVCMLLAEKFGRMARKVGDVAAGEVQFPAGEKSLKELGLVKAERVYTVDMNDPVSMDLFAFTLQVIASDDILDRSFSQVLEALQTMQTNHISSVAIVDKTHGMHTQLQGSISMTDIKEILATRGGWRHLYDPSFRFFAQLRNMQGLETGSDRVPLFTVHPSTPLIVAVEKMSATRTHRVWIVSEGSAAGGRSGDVVGVLELSDVMPILLAACE